MLSILSVNKFRKSLLLNCEGIFRSGDICLIVNLAIELNNVVFSVCGLKQSRLHFILMIAFDHSIDY